ncbi:ABC transporter ATP-binding protein [Rhodococcus sp. NPDC056960]|uniref:ABC transporter ATP-binding protein n=1 Tax=Rhodococcus sp. NPDC056960 TaxID=3345982 RepID=UPI0036311C0C
MRNTRTGPAELIAVDDVSFTVERGECLAIVGQSGSGKTTCARIIAGLEKATSGQVLFSGTPRSTEHSWGGRGRREHARQIQMVFQDPNSSLDPRQTARAAILEVLREHPDLYGPPTVTTATELLERVGLDARTGNLRPRALSGGQKQRVAIARALAAKPSLLILDEAVAALDVSVQAQIINLLEDLRIGSDLAYLFVSHDLGVVRQVSDKCIVMTEGHVVERGYTADVLDNPREEYTRTLLSAIPRPGWTPTRQLAVATSHD